MLAAKPHEARVIHEINERIAVLLAPAQDSFGDPPFHSSNLAVAVQTECA